MRATTAELLFRGTRVLQAQHRRELPYAALAACLAFRGRRLPSFNGAYGIARAAAVARGPAALSVDSAFAQRLY
jgi:hypothetical protein